MRPVVIGFSLVIFIALMFVVSPASEGLHFDEARILTSVILPGLKYIAFYAVMCAGILFSAAFRLIKRGPELVDRPLRAIATSLRSQSFLLGVLVSPIVFAVIASQFETQANVLTAILLSFQNGFFWESIFQKQQPGSN